MASVERKHLSHTVASAVTIAVAVITLAASLYVMLTGSGLVEGLDFGAGAYYYADIPDYEKYMHEEAYRAAYPLWVYVLLFLGWGYLMWRLWIKVERGSSNAKKAN